MLVANRYDILEGRLETEFSFLRGGTLDVRKSCQYVYTVAEIGRLLAQAGLRLKEAHSSFDRTPFRVAAQQLIVVAKKE